jgi:hypothetical protein
VKEEESVNMRFVKTRMSSMMGRPGGVSRDEAVEEAGRLIELVREPIVEEIDQRIGELERLCANMQHGSPEALTHIQQSCDSIIALAQTFGIRALVRACMALADLAYAFQEHDRFRADAIAVHIRAIRLLGPRQPAVSREEVEIMLQHLAKVLRKFVPEDPDAASAAGTGDRARRD